MGKNTVLGDFRLRRRICGKSEMSNRTNRPLHSPSVVSQEIRLKHYAGILLIEFWADLIYDMDTEEAAVWVPDHCQPARVEANMLRAGSSACHDLYQIYQVLCLQMSSWSLNEALILWWTVSGRFVGPIK